MMPPCGTALTFAVIVRRSFAGDPEELERLHKNMCDCPFVHDVLRNDPEKASLKAAMQKLINTGHTGYLCINVDGGKRFLWLE